MAAETMLQQLLNALSLGVMYALIAVGFTLFFGVIEVVNFAHGEIFMLGAFTALVSGTIFTTLGFSNLSFLLFGGVLLVVLVAGAIFGLLLEKFIVRPMLGAQDIMTLLITLGVSIICREAIMLFFPNGRNPQPFPKLINIASFQFGNVLVKPEAVLCIFLSIILISGLYYIIQYTDFGRYIRATAQDRDAALMVGIDVKKVFILTLALGSALGAVAGLINGMNYGIIKFNMGFAAGIKGFAAAVVGGLGNVYGAIAGGLLLGFLEILVVSTLPDGSSYQDIISFLIVIVCLVFRPAGLFGERSYEKV